MKTFGMKTPTFDKRYTYFLLSVAVLQNKSDKDSKTKGLRKFKPWLVLVYHFFHCRVFEIIKENNLLDKLCQLK